MDDRNFSFGTGASAAWFRVLHDGDRLPGWSSPDVNAVTHVFPGAFPPRSEVEIISIGPARLSWRLHFDRLEDYWSLLAKLGTTDTLTVLANVQSHRGAYTEIAGRGYIALPHTTLLALDADTPDPDGTIEAVATFQRHIDPATGEAVTT